VRGPALVRLAATIHAEVVQHAQQRVQQRAGDLVAVTLALDQREQAVHRLARHLCARVQVGTEDLQSHLPERLLADRLHDVGAVEVEEDGAQRVHLLAVVVPRAVHQVEERQRVGRLPEQPVQPLLNVVLALRLQPVVNGARHAVEAHVLHGAIELL